MRKLTKSTFFRCFQVPNFQIEQKICPALLDFAHFQKCANPSQILQFGIRIEDFIQLLGSRNKIFHEVNFDRKARIASLTHATLAWKGVEGVLVFIVVVKIHFLHVKAESPSSWVEALVHTSRTLARKKTNKKILPKLVFDFLTKFRRYIII